MKIVPLSEDAKQKSYYKFINEPLISIPSNEVKRLTSLKGNPEDELSFANRSILQSPNYIPEPEGYYLLKDGGILISSFIETPDLTQEMLEWWMIWHQLDPLRYALWNPEDHYDIKINDKDKMRFLDNSIPLREKIWGTTSHVLESMNGEKPDKIDIKFVDPSTVGFNNNLIGTDSCLAMVVANDFQKIGPLTIPIFMVEILRKLPNGKKCWVAHWWIGCGVKGGKDISIKLPMRGKFAQKAAMLIVHNHKEIRHLNTVLPRIYKENKDNWLE